MNHQQAYGTAQVSMIWYFILFIVKSSGFAHKRIHGIVEKCGGLSDRLGGMHRSSRTIIFHDHDFTPHWWRLRNITPLYLIELLRKSNIAQSC